MEKCKEEYDGNVCNNMYPKNCDKCKKEMVNKKKCGECEEENKQYVSCSGYYRNYDSESYYETVYCLECSEENMKECKITGNKYCDDCVKDCKICKRSRCPECIMECEECDEYVCEVCCLEEGECVECIYPKYVSKTMKKINMMEEEIKELQLELKYQPGGIGYQEAKEEFDSFIIHE